MEQRCFNDLSVSIYRLLYKEFLSTMIKIRKPNVQKPLPREHGINNDHRLWRQPISQERGSRRSSFVIRRMFTEGVSCMSPPMTSVLGVACHSTPFCETDADKEQRIYEKRHIGILLLNTPWQRNTGSKRQVWPWSTEWSRAKANRVLPRERTGHSKHPLPTIRLGADCGSDHELLIAKFRLKWKKVGKTTKLFRYDLNKIPYD